MTRTVKILAMLGGRDLFDVARDAGCTPLQLVTLQLAASGLTDAEIATRRRVARISVLKTRTAACKKIETYLTMEVVSAKAKP